MGHTQGGNFRSVILVVGWIGVFSIIGGLVAFDLWRVGTAAVFAGAGCDYQQRRAVVYGI